MAANESGTQVGKHVGIIGTGVIGLVALKNLKEQGLQVTAIEQNDFIGGTWHATPRKGQVTALPLTTFNTSKHCGHFTDFPFPKDAPTHPPAKVVENYLEAYAKHFDLLRHVQFSTKVTKVERDEELNKWKVYTRSTRLEPADGQDEEQIFDRLVVATGILNAPVNVKIKGIEKFEGETMHSRDFKEPHLYEDKNVLVMGVGATGADTQSFLKMAKARSVYLSHRGQYYLLPRMTEGKAFDHSMSLRAMTIMRSLGAWWPRGCAMLMQKAMISARKKAWPWLSDHPSFKPPRQLEGIEHRVPLFYEDLAENLKSGATKAVTGVREVSGPKSVTLTDGTVLDDIDAIIICSGYHYDFSLIKGVGNPVDPKKAPDNYQRFNAAKYKDPHASFPRLYRGFVSEQFPESLAFLGHVLILGPPFVIYDLVTMALGSLWSGAAPTPTSEEMARDIGNHYNTVVDILGRGPMPHTGFRMFGKETYEWLNRTAGTGVVERLVSFNLEAWKLWWNDRKFYNLLVDGVSSPPVYRLFDTGRGRKAWSGARKAIESNNEDAKQMSERWKKENDSKTK